MKPLRLQSTIVAFVLVLGICSGCSHKKPVLVMPQQPPPTTAPEPTPTPEPEATQPAEQPQAAQQPAATPADQAKTGTGKTKSRNGRNGTARKPASSAPAGDKPGNEVARNTPPKKVIPADKEPPPAPAGGQISPGPTSADTTHSQTSTEQLLTSAETNLNGINRQLSKDEEAMRVQIKEFISQSRKATTENDLARAHNLAVKARLLSDELVKQR